MPARSVPYSLRCAASTAAAASMMPAPYFSSHWTLPGCTAVCFMMRSTSSGLVTPAPTMSAATPAACGEAMEVPWNQR